MLSDIIVLRIKSLITDEAWIIRSNVSYLSAISNKMEEKLLVYISLKYFLLLTSILNFVKVWNYDISFRCKARQEKMCFFGLKYLQFTFSCYHISQTCRCYQQEKISNGLFSEDNSLKQQTRTLPKDFVFNHKAVY